jgi:hypothetical protein
MSRIRTLADVARYRAVSVLTSDDGMGDVQPGSVGGGEARNPLSPPAGATLRPADAIRRFPLSYGKLPTARRNSGRALHGRRMFV